MPKAFPLAHDAGHGPGTRHGDGTDEKCTERLPPGARATIEARLNEDGVMESLYVPPEKWEDTKSAEELRKDQWIEFEARRSGNALRQNEILGKELGKG